MNTVQSICFYTMLGAFTLLLINYGIGLLRLLGAARTLRRDQANNRYADHGRFIKSENTIPVSILLPVYNEAQDILDSVRNLLSLNFPEYEVIVVNDGSTDNTLLLLKLEFELVALQQPYKRSLETADIRAIYRSPLHANLIVIDKVHGGKADALNAGVNIAGYPVFVTMEAGSILERASLVRVIMPFVNDFRVVSVAGMVRVASGWRLERGQPGSMKLGKSPLICLQTVEYLRTFLTGQLQTDPLGKARLLAGGFGAYNRFAAIEAGGFQNTCIAEDIDLTMRLHKKMLENKRPYAIRFLPNPVCWIKSPDQYGAVLRQRGHWHVKLMDLLRAHRAMLLKGRYGKLGLLRLPYIWCAEYFAPVVETLAYLFLLLSWLTGAIGGLFALSTFLMMAFLGALQSIGALLLEERYIARYDTAREMLRLVFYAFVENLGYRQVNALQCVLAMCTFRKRREEQRTQKAA